MSDSWKKSNIKKPVINANKIFTNKLVSKSGVFHNDLTDVCFNDIPIINIYLEREEIYNLTF